MWHPAGVREGEQASPAGSTGAGTSAADVAVGRAGCDGVTNAVSAAPAGPSPGWEGAATMADWRVLRCLQHVLGASDVDHAAAHLVTSIASFLEGAQAVIGVFQEGDLQLAGPAAGASRRGGRELADARVSAMQEAVDQGATLVFPQQEGGLPRITWAHAALSNLIGRDALLTVPLFVAGAPVAALTLQRPRAFTPAEAAGVEHLCSHLAEPLRWLALKSRTPWQAMRAALRDSLRARVSRRRAWTTGGALVAGMAVLGLLLWPVPYVVSAPTRLEGRVQRSVTAPVDGYLRLVAARPGDPVQQGQVLVELDDRELGLTAQRLQAEVQRHEAAYAEALAKQDRLPLVMAAARVAESQAQLDLARQQLEQSRLVAPFDGYVVAGDLVQQLGAPVRKGAPLLTLSPTREVRVVLDVDQRDIARVQAGAGGQLMLAAWPDRSWPLVVDRVMPVALVRDGANVFEVEARLADTSPTAAEALRPGLLGVARLQAGARPIAWQLSHRMLGWLRLQWWAWVG